MWMVSVLRVERFWGQLRCGFFYHLRHGRNQRGTLGEGIGFLGFGGSPKRHFFSTKEKKEDAEGTKLDVDGVLRTGGTI